jgi:SAM-dependent methyltransferase
MTDGRQAARDRAARLLGLDLLPSPDGYVDLLRDEAPAATGLAQRLMATDVVPAVYERWWRPTLGRIAKGPLGPSMRGELRLARALLALRPGDAVVDVACGTGAFSRAFARDVGPEGTVLGLDVSRTMLERAVRDTAAEQVVYVRADITRRALRHGTVDAVCCFAALHLFADPAAALDAMTDALGRGGRIALLTSARPDSALRGLVEGFGRATGMAMFEPDALAEELRRRGLDLIDQQVFGVVQVLGARRP